uniref:40S ribosomal protein S8 n=1 Tax=Gasterosteus aculeatus aculeatus TaxID=481459 RepID=A0AAQ4S1C4_GASAC
MGISRDNWHKRRKTGGKRKPYHKKRKYELGRPPANTKIGPRRIHTVRVRGGNKKYRALRLDVGNFSWGSECCTRKTRIIDVVYNASNNELVRTKTLVKNCIVLVDSLPYRQWYEAHFATPLGRKKGAKLTPEEEEVLNKKRSKRTQKKYDERKKTAKISPLCHSAGTQEGSKADQPILGRAVPAGKAPCLHCIQTGPVRQDRRLHPGRKSLSST